MKPERDLVERAAEIAERTASASVALDPDAPVEDRVRSHLAHTPFAKVMIVAESHAVAREWARSMDLPSAATAYVEQPANLHGVNGNHLIVVIAGADRHPNWRRISRRVNDVIAADTAIVVRVEDPRGEHAPDTVGGIDFYVDAGFRTVEPQPGQGDVLAVRMHSGGRSAVEITELDRASVDRLIRALQAWRDAEPLPDPTEEQAAAIRRAVIEGGDLFGRNP